VRVDSIQRVTSKDGFYELDFALDKPPNLAVLRIGGKAHVLLKHQLKLLRLFKY